MSMTVESRSERVDLRMSPSAKRTLMRAAAASNKTLTEFLVDSGMQAAFDRLADHRTFVLDEEAWQAFVTELDRPATDNAGLQRLLARVPAWES